MSVQEFCRSAFSDVKSEYFVPVNDFFAFLTIISILGIVLETIEGFAPYKDVFLFIEFVTVFFFTLEYLGRIIAAKKPFDYMFSFFGFVDLISIVPTFFGLANWTFLKSTRFLRIVRFLRMIRLAKLLRTRKQHTDIEEHGHDKLFSITVQIYVLTLVSVILLSATFMWFVEGDREVFKNIPVSMIWSSKVLLGGVPQAMPDTYFGEFIVIITRFIGLALFGLLINIIGGSIKRLLLGAEELKKVRVKK